MHNSALCILNSALSDVELIRVSDKQNTRDAVFIEVDAQSGIQLAGSFHVKQCRRMSIKKARFVSIRFAFFQSLFRYADEEFDHLVCTEERFQCSRTFAATI